MIRIAPIALQEMFNEIESDLEEEVIVNIRKALNIFDKHVQYVALLASHEISSETLDGIIEKIHEVHREGSEFYEKFRKSKRIAASKFLTIDSHTAYHYVDLIKRFGSVPCFSSIAFGKSIRGLRNMCNENYSRRSARIALPKKYWVDTLVDCYIHKNRYSLNKKNDEIVKESRKGKILEIVTSSGLVIRPNNFYLVEDGRVVEVESIEKRDTSYLINCRMIKVVSISEPQFSVTNDDDGQLILPSSEFLRKVNIWPTEDAMDICYY